MKKVDIKILRRQHETCRVHTLIAMSAYTESKQQFIYKL